MNSFKASISLS